MLEQKDKEILDKKIEDWKNKLIDLSRRNRLLNFKPTKVTTIKIIDELPSEIFKSLVIDNKSFHFLTKREDDLLENYRQINRDESDEEFYTYDSNVLEDKHIDLNLQTNLPEENLHKNLKRIHFRSNQLMEEQGYNILYLTLGMIEWYDAEHSDMKNKSPLIMLPVELRKRSIKSKFKLYKTDEEPFINPALQYKMNSDFGLDLPNLLWEEEGFNPQNYMEDITKLIDSNDRWKLTNEIYLGLFSFAKFVMFKDLEVHNKSFLDNAIIKALAGINRETDVADAGDYITADELDKRRKPTELFQVLDADSSQQEAIESVKSGNSIVIQGPPGTGKSQTIANLIVELLVNDYKVLFVSEKMAALDVVYKRLKTVGISEYCLEIHSRKANKKHVLNQLAEAYEVVNPGTPEVEENLGELVSIRDQLNLYSSILHSPVDPFGHSPYWFIGQLNQLKDIEILDIDLSNLNDITFEQYDSLLKSIESLEERLSIIGHPHKHPFFGCEIETINEYQQQTLEKNIKESLSSCLELDDIIKKFSSSISTKLPNLDTANSYCKLLSILLEDHELPESLTKIKDMDQFIKDINPVLEQINTFKEQRRKILAKYEHSIFEEDINSILTKLSTSFKYFTRYFFPEYYKIRNSIKNHSKEERPIPFAILLEDIQNISLNLDLEEQIKATPRSLIDPLSSLWNNSETQSNIIISTLNWLIKYRESRISESDDETLMQFVLSSNVVTANMIELKNNIESKISILLIQMESIKLALNVVDEIVFPQGIDKVSTENIANILNKWNDNLHSIVDWTRYLKAFTHCREAGLEIFFAKILSQNVELEQLRQKFKRTFLYNLFTKIINENPILKNFEALTQDQIVKKFQELDLFQLEAAKLRAQAKLYNNKPDSSWEGTKSSQLGYLQRQFRLKRGHHAIRKIFTNVPDIVQQLCPCFMMSPISLAQYINPESIKFDFVIFDEASQISPVDSLGAIIRGEKLVCVGDTKQLPPTTFFERVVQTESDDDLDDLSTPDLESILDECLIIGMKEFNLSWHYRSRHESLIHFSNKSFYKNNLITFPSASLLSDKYGLSMNYVKNAFYDRGGSQKNRREAKEVAKAVFDHFKTNSQKTLGVGTFSQSQQSAIYDELEILRNNDPSLEHFFSGDMEESFFVKNLETIQGDERDVIFISVGYGRDENGKLTMNFGPLNKEGGERRLNVLITRARDKVKVFSSILGHDFDLTKTQSSGVHHLKRYLDFAESNGDKSLLNRSPDFSGDFDESNIFERSVYQQLTEKGILVKPQVGYAGYKIDFGILHPDKPSTFILAVECDGASYHTSKTARDRDRLRQQILENLGWRFFRIWSTDWFLNPSREMSKLLKAIEKAKSEPLNLHNNMVKPDIVKKTNEPEKPINQLGIAIIPYEEYPITILGWPDDFYYEVKTSNKIGRLIENISKVESPIHIKELSLRVIQHYDMKKVGSKILRIIDFQSKQLHREGAVYYKNSFVYTSKSSYKKIRKRDGINSISNIEFISSDEVENSILLALSKEISIPREELIPRVARVFGFQHTGKKIQDHIKKRIASLLRRNIIYNSSFGLKISE